MLKYVMRRLLLTIPVLLGVTVVIFLILHLTPGDPAQLMLGTTATQETVAELRNELGLDRPLYEQYFRWMAGLFRGDLGRSIWSTTSVANEVTQRFQATLILSGASLILAIVFGIAIGTASAVWKNTPIDSISMTFAVLGVSLPSFWIGLMLLVLFSLKLRWLPISGMQSPQGGGVEDLLRHLLLPALALAIPNVAIIARLMRSALLEVLGQDYIRTAAAKGLGKAAVIFHHAFKNALIPVLTVIGVLVGNLLSGAVVVETVFAWPGLGTLALTAILSRDIPLVQGVTLFVAVLFIAVNLIVDVLYVYLDPRIRYQ